MSDTTGIWVTVLAGGIGSRFWPVSTPARPKQLLPLASQRPLIVDTLERARDVTELERIRILTGREIADPIRRATGLDGSAFLLEPFAKGTGPVLAWAAHAISRLDPDAVIISLHSDHVIRPPEAFTALLHVGARLARDENLLLTVAVPPDRPETGYGYIRPGADISTPDGYRAFHVDSFVEKPDATTAAEYVSKGYRWNSGIFLWPARTFLTEVQQHAPEIAKALPFLDDDDVLGFFENVDDITVDEAVLERSGRVGSIEATFAWDDVGSWEALSRTREGDSDGNVSHGDVHLVESSGNIAVADEGRLVLLGVKDLVVVRTGDLTMVIPRTDAPDLKKFLSQLPPEARSTSGANS